MKNIFKKTWREAEEPEQIVECEKGHKIPVSQSNYYVVYRSKQGDLILKSKNICPICYVEFFDKNISGFKHER